MTTAPNATDATQNAPHPRRHPLDALFAPRAVAVIGATDEAQSVGRAVLHNLTSSTFKGRVVPINPHRETVLNLASFPTIGAAPGPIDLAVIATPAQTVPDLITECGAAGVSSAIVLAAGFRERGADGLALEQAVLAAAERGGVRVLGPNCLGIMRPPTGLNATFAAAMARPGNVAFLSQSGALCTAILDWSVQEHTGFSAFISVGSMLDVGWGDLIDRLGDDPYTESIIMYMETVGDARQFLSAAREVALTKPVIVLKGGRTDAAAQAAVSHTGSLVGSDAVLNAAFERSGVLRVDTIGDLFHMAEVLAKQPRPRGPRLLIVTNAGGPGVLAVDALIRSGGQLAQLAEETVQRLDAVLPAWSRNNPVDILGDADPQRYAQTLEIVTRDPQVDGLLVIRTPQVSAEPAQVANVLVPYAKTLGKPVLASWMGGAAARSGTNTLQEANIPTFSYPDTAARMFSAMWRYTENLRNLYVTPTLPNDDDEPDRVAARHMVQTARKQGCTLLTEGEAKQLLVAYGIPVLPTRVAHSADEAITLANELGYPVVLKLYSPTITHKTDVEGVQLNLHHAEAVRVAYTTIIETVTERIGAEHIDGISVQPMIRDGYELILGSTVDPQFGPVLLVGSGGTLVDVLDDRVLGLPPLTTTLARNMLEQTKIVQALRGIRGRAAVDLAALEQLLVRFSQLVIEQPQIREIEINPLHVWWARHPDREPFVALDARATLWGPEISDEQLPRPAIRPYPRQYLLPWALKDGTPVTIRPILPEDEPLMVQFHRTLGERSVYMRYFAPMTLSARTAHERLVRICFIDYDREMALVIERADPQTGERAIIAVGRLIKKHAKHEAEWAILVSDRYQGHGMGTELLRQLLRVARDERLDRVTAEILPENRAMQKVAQTLGHKLKHVYSEGIVRAELDLHTP